MQVRVDIYFRIATSDTQVKFEKGHRETEKQKNKEKEDPGKPHGREMKKRVNGVSDANRSPSQICGNSD